MSRCASVPTAFFDPGWNPTGWGSASQFLLRWLYRPAGSAELAWVFRRSYPDDRSLEIDGQQLEHGTGATGREPLDIVAPGAVLGRGGRVKELERSFCLDDLHGDATESVPVKGQFVPMANRRATQRNSRSVFAPGPTWGPLLRVSSLAAR